MSLLGVIIPILTRTRGLIDLKPAHDRGAAITGGRGPGAEGKPPGGRGLAHTVASVKPGGSNTAPPTPGRPPTPTGLGNVPTVKASAGTLVQHAPPVRLAIPSAAA